MLTPDSPAPDFTLPSDDGRNISLSDLRGGPAVLFFYPKDNTPGCTAEAIDFTAHLPEFQSLNCRVIGISKDSLKKHQNFREKHGLRVTLLSDADSDVCERYSVWQEKKLYGKTFMGIVRTTVLIDADGLIRRVWPKVKVAGHAEDVLAAVRAL